MPMTAWMPAGVSPDADCTSGRQGGEAGRVSDGTSKARDRRTRRGARGHIPPEQRYPTVTQRTSRIGRKWPSEAIRGGEPGR
jgi:hypothetical protein